MNLITFQKIGQKDTVENGSGWTRCVTLYSLNILSFNQSSDGTHFGKSRRDLGRRNGTM